MHEADATMNHVVGQPLGEISQMQTRAGYRSFIASTIRPLRAIVQTRGDLRTLGVVFRCMRGTCYSADSLDEHLQDAMRWLCTAQDVTGCGGVAAYFDLARGAWAPTYPETTGYIIPTFFDYAEFTGDPTYRDRALDMARWLLTLQLPNGAFPLGPLWSHWERKPIVFDTGQIIHGLIRAFEETNQSEFIEASCKAGDWLLKVQSPDGSWTNGEYLEVAHAYSARVSWALVRLYEACHEERFREGGRLNLEWCRDQQGEDAWFRNASFLPGREPLTHTIAYTIRGLLEGGLLLKDDTMVSAARRAAACLSVLQERDGYLRGTYGPGWRSSVDWSCLTGVVQMAQIWLRLYQLFGDSRDFDAAVRANIYVMARQVRRSGVPGVDGGIAGSFPIQGAYQSFQFVNWAAKFFVDSLLLESAIRSPGFTASLVAAPSTVQKRTDDAKQGKGIRESLPRD